MALQAARLNSTRLNLQTEVVASDGLKISSVNSILFLSPAFHQGKDTNYQFAQNLFRDAKNIWCRMGNCGWLPTIIALRRLGGGALCASRNPCKEQGFKIIFGLLKAVTPLQLPQSCA